MKKISTIFVLLAGLFTVVPCVAGGTQNLIQVIGLSPGVSTRAAFMAAGPRIDDDFVYLEIGGYKLPCSGAFVDGLLSQIICLTGKKYTSGSNYEIHDTLLKGFTTKFGAPSSTDNTPTRNRLGVSYPRSEIWWNDRQGNALILYSVQGKVDEGSMILLSASEVRAMKEEIAKKDAERKF